MDKVNLWEWDKKTRTMLRFIKVGIFFVLKLMNLKKNMVMGF